jgi:hypothetical protein
MRIGIAGFLILALVSVTFANAYGAFGGMGRPGFGKEGALPKNSKAAAPVSGALLLEDGSSILLLEGGSGNLCLEGGC